MAVHRGNMSRRKRRIRRRSPSDKADQYATGWHGLVGLLGIGLALFALLYAAAIGNNILFWSGASDYVRTELLIKEVVRDPAPEGQDFVIGIVQSNGAEVRTYPVLYEIATVAGTRNMAATGQFRRLLDNEAVGKRVPIWYSEKRNSIYFVYEYPEIPRGDQIALHCVIISVIALCSAVCLVKSFRWAQLWAAAQGTSEVE